MRIVFFGTGEFSTVVLKSLVDSGKQVVAVVSQPDKVNGRNGKSTFSPIKQYCLSNNIKLFQFEKLNREGEQPLKELSADIFVTASYGQIIRQNILDIPPLGCYNVHASLLPKYRGSSPIQWAIMNGETVTGITIMKTELGLDCGDMYLKKQIEITEEDTSSSVFSKLATLGAECINEFLDNFNTMVKNGEKQDESQMTYFPMIKKEDYLLNFNNTSKAIVNKVRALESCYFVYHNMRYKVLEAKAISGQGTPGQILNCNSKLGLIIATKDTAVEIVTIQPEGKQKMPAKAYMNANKFVQNEIIEPVLQ